MSVHTIRRTCSTCGQKRPFQKQGVNHVLHLILTIITVGVWVVVWILLALMNGFTPYRCSVCGKAAVW